MRCCSVRTAPLRLIRMSIGKSQYFSCDMDDAGNTRPAFLNHELSCPSASMISSTPHPLPPPLNNRTQYCTRLYDPALVLQPQRVFISHFTFAGASNLRTANCDAYISRSIILQSQKGDHYPHFCLFSPFSLTAPAADLYGTQRAHGCTEPHRGRRW